MHRVNNPSARPWLSECTHEQVRGGGGRESSRRGNAAEAGAAGWRTSICATAQKATPPQMPAKRARQRHRQQSRAHARTRDTRERNNDRTCIVKLPSAAGVCARQIGGGRSGDVRQDTCTYHGARCCPPTCPPHWGQAAAAALTASPWASAPASARSIPGPQVAAAGPCCWQAWSAARAPPC